MLGAGYWGPHLGLKETHFADSCFIVDFHNFIVNQDSSALVDSSVGDKNRVPMQVTGSLNAFGLIAVRIKFWSNRNGFSCGIKLHLINKVQVMRLSVCQL